jgi:IS5 family transposase
MVRVKRNAPGTSQDYRHAPESMNLKPSRFSVMANAATLKFLQEEVMVRLKEERVLGKKAMQQREGKKSKLDHFLRNQDQPKENWKGSIKEHESFP